MLNNNERKYFIDLINELQDLHFDEFKKISKVNCWPMIRIHIGYSLLFGPKNIPNRQNELVLEDFSIKGIEIIWLIRFYIKKLFSKVTEKTKKSILLFGYKNNYSYTNHYSTNPYISPVRREFEKLGETIEEFVFPDISGQHNNNQDFRTFEELQHYNRIIFKIKNLFSGDNYSAFQNARIAQNFLQDRGISHSNEIASSLYKYLIQQEINYNAFKGLLKRIRPKLVWTYCYYDYRGLSLIRAANSLKIKNIEYQHSVQGDLHIAYSKWKNSDSFSEWFPKIFWVWTQRDGDRIVNNFSGLDYIPQIIVGGNLNLIKEKEFEGEISPPNVKAILVSLQGQWIPEFVEEFIKEDKEYTWYFRLHPRYPSDRHRLVDLKAKFPQKIEIEKANNPSIAKVFSEVRYNLTDYSGVALEAEGYGVINIIVGSLGAEVFREEIINSEFLFAGNKEELKRIFYKEDFRIKNNSVTDREEVKELLRKIISE
jgi:hypothetical protein